MIKICPLGPFELKQVLTLLERYSEGESEYAMLRQMQQLYIPMHRLIRILPLGMQFLPGLFVAVANKKVLGLIGLSKDGQQARRWKIDHLIIDPDSSTYDIGTQLISYVVNRYGGEGVQTFLAEVDQHDTISMGLLKSSGFRQCTRSHYFSSRSGLVLNSEISIEGIREFRNIDADSLSQLYREMLPPDARVSLDRSANDFKRHFLKIGKERLKGSFFKRWIVADSARDCLTSCVELSSRDYKNFHIKLYNHPAWDTQGEGLLSFAINQANKMTSQAEFTSDCYECFSQSIRSIEAAGFHRDGVSQVLVKDYWIPIQDKGNRLKSPLLLFSGRPSPALN